MKRASTSRFQDVPVKEYRLHHPMYTTAKNKKKNKSRVKAQCSCKKWSFHGDWDEMVKSFYGHLDSPYDSDVSLLTKAEGEATEKLRNLPTRHNPKKDAELLKALAQVAAKPITFPQISPWIPGPKELKKIRKIK